MGGATAKSAIQIDIADTLGLKRHVTVIEPLALSRITIDAVHAATAERTTVLSDLAKREDLLPMVVFCVLRRQCESVAAILQAHGIKPFVYHAGLPSDLRTSVANAFPSSD